MITFKNHIAICRSGKADLEKVDTIQEIIVFLLSIMFSIRMDELYVPFLKVSLAWPKKVF